MGLFKLSLAAIFAACVGAAVVVGVLFREAQTQVRERLASGIWETPGRVWSAPVEVWRGLTLDPEAMAKDLQSAGYARVKKATEAGDFEVSADRILVINPARSGPGWSIKAGEVAVSFASGRVSAVVPTEPAIFAPAQLAALRGDANEDRTPRAVEDFPEFLRTAVLAMEDAHFYEHRGVSPLGIARALYVNTVSGDAVQGGSTLTQQLAKNLFLSQERTLSRKANELLLALALEQELNKDEILGLYLNEIYWGQAGGAAICGADQAARAYFGKPVERLSPGESATLAGIISSPNNYSPLRHPDKAQQRRDLALDRMVAEGWLDVASAESEKAKPLVVIPGVSGRSAPYAVDAAIDGAEKSLGSGVSAEGGLSLYTSIHPPLQRLAESVVAESMTKLEAAYPNVKGVQAALVAVRVRDGAVLALVGGRDYGSSQYNRALLAARQIGSTVKPLTMLAAFDGDDRLSPAEILIDEPIERVADGKTWRPANYDGQYVGEITLRDAIAHSRNIPAVLLAERVGMSELQSRLQKLGLDGATRLPSAALGAFEATPIELAGAYTVFPGRGAFVAPWLLNLVTDDHDQVLLRHTPAPSRQASARAAYMATSVLESVISAGTGASAVDYGAKGAMGGKTGTTDEYRDAWFVGFTPEVVVAVWVGFDESRMLGLSGAKAALPTWARFIAGSGLGRGKFDMPKDVALADWCKGDFEAGVCQECVQELFTRGQEPTNGCQPGLLSGVLDQIRGVNKVPSPGAGTPHKGTKAPTDNKPKKKKFLWW